jgi:hypothetical protein
MKSEGQTAATVVRTPAAQSQGVFAEKEREPCADNLKRRARSRSFQNLN